jgi:carboxyl-terminal processing protease
VKNVGKGRSYETQANLRNLSGDGILLHDGRFDLPSLAPGDVRKVAFTFDVEPQLTDNEAKVELTVADRDLREVATEKVKIPVEAPVALAAQQGAVKVGSQPAVLLDEPEPTGHVFGRLASGTVIGRLAKAGDYVKVDLGQGRFGFVSSKAVSDGGTPSGAVAFEDVYSHAPPLVEVASAALATRDSHMKISGVASDGTRLLDTYIFVGSRKVFYRSNQGAKDASKEPFDIDAPLRPGVNVINVFARESPDTIGRKTIIVRRDGPNGELLTTPTTEDSLWDSLDEE